MSKWRQRGFVQDSDEDEEESQIESQHSRHGALLDTRVDRVDKGHEVRGVDRQQPEVPDDGQHGNAIRAYSSSLERGVSPERPIISLPTTPTVGPALQQEPPESPDPLQSSPTQKAQWQTLSLSSQLLGSSTHQRSPTALATKPNHGQAAPSQPSSSARVVQKTTSASEVLVHFGITPLSDDSDNESLLSDPPSDMDLESPPLAPMSYVSPHRRTAVQVVIPSMAVKPSSTALQQQIAEEETRRQFRQRKPIQMHPYMLEGELYRREVQSRGLKPVPRERSPQRKPSSTGAETQEKEFDPNESSSSSPFEPEIPVSTPSTEQTKRDAQKPGPTRRNILDQGRRRTPTIHHDPRAVKRRKPNPPITQTVVEPSRAHEISPVPHDIWSVPPDSPPYSSSPPRNGHQSTRQRQAKPLAITPAPNLPTPSNSSTFQDEYQWLHESDQEPVPRSVRRGREELRRPTRVVLSESSDSDSEARSSEFEQGDSELRKVGKKIKGVLPASWLRIDQQAQEKRTVRERERERARLSAELTEPQRGVAQKILRRTSQPVNRASVSPSRRNIISISDDSEPELDNDCGSRNIRTDFEDASALAAMFDSRYADDDNDLAGMEHDILPLYTLGGTRPKRKRQPKIIESLGNTKRTKASSNGVRSSRPAKRTSGGNFTRGKHGDSRKPRRTPPAMGIMDPVSSPSGKTCKTPQFIKIAQRQARRRPDQARQSSSNKYIRLHNVQDTEDANATLLQWRQGVIKPQEKLRSSHQLNKRVPPEAVSDNSKFALPPPTAAEGDSGQSLDTALESTTNIRPKEVKALPNGLLLFQRSSDIVRRSLQRKKKPAITISSGDTPRQQRIQPRTAQLEEDEEDFDPHLRTRAFEKALRQVDQQFRVQQPVSLAVPNPQVARLLADDSAMLQSPPGNEIVGLPEANACKKRQPKKRLVRKVQAQRIDIDTREYRQPIEPAIHQVFEGASALTDEVQQEQLQSVLKGLGPFGTRYPTTFDVAPLKSDTYFHSSTLIGSDDLRRALLIGTPNGRDMNQRAGYCSISHATVSIRCGPWNDDTYSQISDLVEAIWVPLENSNDNQNESLWHENASAHSLKFLRSLISYIHTYVSFLDPIDRKSFVGRFRQLLSSLRDRLDLALLTTSGYTVTSSCEPSAVRALAYLLVAAAEIFQIAQYPIVENSDKIGLINLIRNIATSLAAHVVKKGMPVLDRFFEKNKRHLEREKGIQDDEILVESILVCMHVLDSLDISDLGFWDVISKELSLLASKATHVETFEKSWATIFMLLPFTELDVSGIPDKTRVSRFSRDNWSSIRDMLKRLFDLYPNTSKENSSSLNEYIRANLARCHVLIHDWHWKRPEQMLNATLDFYGKMGLRPLWRERNSSPATFLQTPALEGSLAIGLNDGSFLISLKCLALGLQGMANAYPEKKVRSFVIRRIPNHGRSYPKDQPLEEEALVALRNHHDLLCTLYWAAPPPCRPKLELIRDLVNHESSHREACRLSVSAWANLTAFQISNDEPYDTMKQFALWHKEIMYQTLKQYQLAKIEAEDYLKSGVLDGTTEVSAIMVRQTMERNQEQVIGTLRDCIAGVGRAIQSAHDLGVLSSFLADADVVHLLELPHLEDRRLVAVIRDALRLFRDYARACEAPVVRGVDQQTSEESQDYGEFPDLEELEDTDSDPPTSASRRSGLGFVQPHLWRLLSNAFGAETPPDKSLLEDCVDIWVLIAKSQIASGEKSWSHYIDSFSQVSWKQLRHTDQTRKFDPYFLASLIECDSTAYTQHRHEFLTSLLLCLVDRESLLGFQHRLLNAVVRADPRHPLFKNLPFIRNEQTGLTDITHDTVQSRRLTVLSSMLSNMRDDVQTTLHEDPKRAPTLKRTYSSMLKDVMVTMKNNYLQLQQGELVTGTYVDFVQRIVQFLTQYTSDICPVLPFFTDSVAFPLPTTDPTYVIGRLCGYASKAGDLGTAKQLSVFVQTVAQQAAVDNQGPYLVHQLTTALCTEDPTSADRATLRSVLCQAIFPVYIEHAFSSKPGFLLASPILQSLPTVLDTMIFDLRITISDSVLSILRSVVSILHAFVRSTEQLKGNAILFKQPHILCALSHLFETALSSVRLLDYITGRTLGSTGVLDLPLVAYLERLGTYVAQMVSNVVSQEIPSYLGDAHADSELAQNIALLAFSRTGVEESLKMNWSENQDIVYFGQGHARREVVINTSSYEEEQAQLSSTINAFYNSIHT